MRILTLATASLATILTGCGGSSSSGDRAWESSRSSTARTIEIPVKAVAGTTDISCDATLQSLGTAGSSTSLADFRFFVHDLAVVTDEGQVIPVALDADAKSQNADVALLDFRDKDENCAGEGANTNFNDTITIKVDVDSELVISDLQFTLGVPFELNHLDQSLAEAPLDNPGTASGMAWSWQVGYKFTGLDVKPVGGITRPGEDTWSSNRWNLHIGSTGCSADTANGEEPEPCDNPNRTTIKLPLEGANLEDIAIQLDYAKLVEGSNLSQDEGGASGCMSGFSDPECPAVFERLGLPWGDAEAVEQSVFSIVPK